MPQKQWFEFYSESFDTVEINNTFYRLPAEETVAGWARKARKGFLFSVKASRYVTHIKRLKDVQESVSLILGRVRLLGEHLGPVLYQLPPKFNCDLERFEDFLKLLPDDIIHVFEFRDQRWINDDVFSLLVQYKVSHCVHDMGGLNIPRRAVGPVAYVRFHGMNGRFHGNYPDSALSEWAQWLKNEAEENGRDVYAYFNNDVEAHAVFNAQKLREQLTE
jgi:uncharacterized protein YecE (DUF72 family)